MDVLIKNMSNKPKNCILEEHLSDGTVIKHEVVELPPHGELKDADFIISCLEEIKDTYPRTYEIVKGILDRTPTVLEANNE